MQGTPSPRRSGAIATPERLQAPAALLLALTLSTALAAGLGCGPTVRVEPLIGEEPELLRHVATTTPDLRDHPPTNAVRALHDALVREDMGRAWSLLTTDTRAALDAAAAAVGAPSGEALFRAADREGVPLLREGAAPMRVTPLTWLLREGVASYRLTLDPEAEPQQTASEAVVYVIDSENRYREVRLRKENGEWRVHQPTVRYGDLVADLP